MTDTSDHSRSQLESDCEAALAELYEYLDGELTPELKVTITAHLDACVDCLQVYDFEAELRHVIAQRCRHDTVPESLRIRVAEAIAMEATTPPGPTLGPV